jgi:hypothetical protein
MNIFLDLSKWKLLWKLIDYILWTDKIANSDSQVDNQFLSSFVEFIYL